MARTKGVEKRKIVYTYCWRGLITIVRLDDGVWEYRYKWSNFFDFLNEKRYEDRQWSHRSPKDCLDAGKMFGMQVQALLTECRESYEKSKV